MEWEATLDSSRVIEALSDDTLIFHQTLKRVWPAAQRETCFWSHLRAIPITDEARKYQDMSDWIVINYSTNHDMAPVLLLSILFPLLISIPFTHISIYIDPISFNYY
jgi:collagen type IV alpha-3-binding protein